MIPKDYEGLYQRLGRLVAETPVVVEHKDLRTPEAMLWLARAHALVEAVDIGTDAMEFRTLTNNQLNSMSWSLAFRTILGMVYRAMAECELKGPTSASGAFIPVGSSFDAFAAVSKLLQSASSDVLIVDPYLDEAVLTDFASAVPAGAQLRLLADAADHKASLVPASKRWVAQHGATRPLATRLAPAKALHDRAIFVDGTKAWTLTQSLKDFAKRSPAEIVRADDTAPLKIAAYEAIWSTSTVVV